jgi:hypothetical protein
LKYVEAIVPSKSSLTKIAKALLQKPKLQACGISVFEYENLGIFIQSFWRQRDEHYIKPEICIGRQYVAKDKGERKEERCINMLGKQEKWLLTHAYTHTHKETLVSQVTCTTLLVFLQSCPEVDVTCSITF